MVALQYWRIGHLGISKMACQKTDKMALRAYLHCRIRTRIQTRILAPNPMATLRYVEVFTLHTVGFRFKFQLPTKGMGLESESIPMSVSGRSVAQ